MNAAFGFMPLDLDDEAFVGAEGLFAAMHEGVMSETVPARGVPTIPS